MNTKVISPFNTNTKKKYNYKYKFTFYKQLQLPLDFDLLSKQACPCMGQSQDGKCGYGDADHHHSLNYDMGGGMRYSVFFLTGTPLKSSKYKRVNLG